MKRFITKASLTLLALPLCAIAAHSPATATANAPAPTVTKQDFLLLVQGTFAKHFVPKFCEVTYEKKALAKAGQYKEKEAEKVIALMSSVAPQKDCPKLASAILKGVTEQAYAKLPDTLTQADVNKHIVSIAQEAGEIYGGYYTKLGLFTAGAKKHDAKSEHQLYTLYSTDVPGIPKDMTKANYWLKRAQKDGYKAPKS